MYSASKIFDHYVSESLVSEYHKKIDILGVFSGWVTTRMSGYHKDPLTITED